eukprot:1288017-Prymnesium_polylepis.1
MLHSPLLRLRLLGRHGVALHLQRLLVRRGHRARLRRLPPRALRRGVRAREGCLLLCLSRRVVP